MPFVLDQRLPEDTLFWIMEEDFRFWPPQKDPDRADDYEEEYTILRAARSSHESSGSSLPPSLGASTSYSGSRLPPWNETSKSKAQERLSTQYHVALPKGDSREEDENQGFSQDVVDLMRIATMCHREGWGNLIWVTWVPKKKRRSFIGHGSGCILMTKAGMECVKGAMERKVLRRGHIDLELQSWLYTNDEAQLAHACWLYPPIGSYTEHESGCDPKNFGEGKTRPSGFFSGEKPCHGCRVEGDLYWRTKMLYQWKGGGGGGRVEKLFPSDSVLHDAAFDWKSYEEPTAFDDGREQPEKAVMTQREKRALRSFQKRMSMRNWVGTIEEAVCVVEWCILQTLKLYLLMSISEHTVWE